jgi:hypothetical protein
MSAFKYIAGAALAVWVLGTGLTTSLATGSLAWGDIIDYSASGPDKSETVSGDALFKLSGATLEIDLTNNTTSANMQSTADLLTAVEFNLNGMTLSGGSASGKTVNVNNDLTLSTPSATQALDSGWGGGNLSRNPDEYAAAAGLGIGSGFAFDDKTMLDGAAYGLIPAIAAVGNADGFASHNPYTYGTVVLTFTVTGSGTLANNLSNVKLLWGTTPDATVPVQNGTLIVPEPATGVLLMSVLLGGLARRRRIVR